MCIEAALSDRQVAERNVVERECGRRGSVCEEEEEVVLCWSCDYRLAAMKAWSKLKTR